MNKVFSIKVNLHLVLMKYFNIFEKSCFEQSVKLPFAT